MHSASHIRNPIDEESGGKMFESFMIHKMDVTEQIEDDSTKVDEFNRPITQEKTTRGIECRFVTEIKTVLDGDKTGLLETSYVLVDADDVSGIDFKQSTTISNIRAISDDQLVSDGRFSVKTVGKQNGMLGIHHLKIYLESGD